MRLPDSNRSQVAEGILRDGARVGVEVVAAGVAADVKPAGRVDRPETEVVNAIGVGRRAEAAMSISDLMDEDFKTWRDGERKTRWSLSRSPREVVPSWLEFQ